MRYLYSKEDMDWLAEVHLPQARDAKYATIHGSEDCPSKIELYANHLITSHVATYVWNDYAKGYYEQKQ